MSAFLILCGMELLGLGGMGVLAYSLCRSRQWADLLREQHEIQEAFDAEVTVL